MIEINAILIEEMLIEQVQAHQQELLTQSFDS
jgi:hypothetical protein